MRKMYFIEKDDEYCWDADTARMQTDEAYEAIPYRLPGYFWCREFDEVGERGHCGKQCSGYTPRNGISGICKHFGVNLYKPGRKVKI